VDYEYLADKTEGFSGADLAALCKAAAKTAIRRAIAAERTKFELNEQKRKEAEEKGETFIPSDDSDEIDTTPYLTKQMLLSALSGSRRSVTKQDLERYMKYKRDMERRLGMDEGAGAEISQGPVVGLDAEDRRRPIPASGGSTTTAGGTATSDTQPSNTAASRSFADAPGDDDDDIYG